LKPTAFQDFYELHGKATNPVLGQHIFFTEPIDPVRIKDLSVIQVENFNESLSEIPTLFLPLYVIAALASAYLTDYE